MRESIMQKCVYARILCSCLVIALLSSNSIASAQSKVEYFWDTDPGLGAATELANVESQDATDGTYTISFDITTENLSVGLHQLGMRVVTSVGDVQYYSPTAYSYVVKTSDVVNAGKVEYFWDEDPGFGKAQAVTESTNEDGTVSFDVSVDGLTEGVHRLCFRSLAEYWSPTLQYLVCIEDGALQVIDAIEYAWDKLPAFGEGTTVTFIQGTSVELTDYQIPTEGMTGDHTLYIRAHSKGGWSPFVASTIIFSAEGSYTLDETQAEGTERNFRSLGEMFAEFSARGVSSDITLTVRDNATFKFDATTAENLAMAQSVADDLKEYGGRITFAATSAATINLTCNDTDLATLLALAVNIDLKNVTLNINSTAYDFSLLAENWDQVCSGKATVSRNWGDMNNGVTVSWTAAASSSNVKGYTTAGTGNLPSMTLTNTGSDTYNVTYTVTLTKGDTEFYSYIYTIYVDPAIAAKTITYNSSTPSHGAIVDPGTMTVKWGTVGGAYHYVVTVESTAADGTVATSTTEEYGTSVAFEAETGYSYTFKVKAVGPCDETAENSRSITTFKANADDLAALRVLYNVCGGEGWSKQWLFDAEVLKSSNFPGVTFNADGRVTAVDVSGCSIATAMLPTSGFALPYLTTLNLSNNVLTVDLPIAFLAELPVLATLNLSYNQLTGVDDAWPTTITSLDLSYQHRVYGNSSQLHDLTALGTIALALDDAYDADFGQNALMQYNPSSAAFELRDAALSNTYAKFVYDDGFYRLSFTDNVYAQSKDAELIMLQTSGTAKGSVQPVKVSFVEADANVDQLVDVKDVQHTLNYVVAEEGAEGLFNWSAANTFDDELINIQDVVVTVNRVLENTNATAQARARRMTVAERAKAHGRLYVEDGYLCLEADTAVAALDVELQGTSATQIRLILLGSDWQMMSRATDEGVRLVIFSPTGQTLPKGTTQLLALRADKVSPIAAEAADAKARSLTIGVEGGNATGLNATELAEALTAYLEDATLTVESTMECEGVTLTLYDPAGRQLVQYADVALQAGSNVWSVGTAQQGIYLLQVRMANGTTDVIRIAAK